MNRDNTDNRDAFVHRLSESEIEKQVFFEERLETANGGLDISVVEHGPRNPEWRNASIEFGLKVPNTNTTQHANEQLFEQGRPTAEFSRNSRLLDFLSP